MRKIQPLFLMTLLLLAPTQSLAEDSMRPFDPAFAADQKQITSRSIEFEGLQFQRIGEWLIVRDQVETKRLEKQQALDTLNRVRHLHEKGLASEMELKQAEYNLTQAVSALEIVISQQQLQKAHGLKFKFLLLDEGNADEDYRLEVARAQKVAHEETEKIYVSQLSGARAGVVFWNSQVERNQKLYEKRLIKKSELERSELILKMSQDQLATIEHKISSNKLALEGVEKTLKALGDG